ncbi:MAG TPA: aspartate/glutamate racemase family protein [Bryobacteraceae bacterium]|nr:aspartate/glutamate racemase family protein [Bryobacteraceae bacterium]
MTAACIHTVIPLIELFRTLAARSAPQLHVMHILDEAVFARIRHRGRLDREDSERLRSHVQAALDAGAGAVLVTCSTLSPCVEDLPVDVRPRVLKIDDVLMREAVARGERTLIAATNFATLEPSRQTLLQAGAQEDPETVLIPDAFAAFQAGDLAEHDRLLLRGLLDLQQRPGTIVLAQASMARVTHQLPEDLRRRVLSSPELALKALTRFASDPPKSASPLARA